MKAINKFLLMVFVLVPSFLVNNIATSSLVNKAPVQAKAQALVDSQFDITVSYSVDGRPVSGMLAEIKSPLLNIEVGRELEIRVATELPAQVVGVSSSTHPDLDVRTFIDYYYLWDIIFTMPESDVHLVIDITYGRAARTQPADFGFEEQYFFDEKTKLHSIENIKLNTFEDIPLQTTRLRAGFISDQYVVLSARRENAGTAFISYKFPDNRVINSITVDLALWSASELLRKPECTALIQYRFDDSNWYTSLDLLNDVTLTTNRLQPLRYTIDFPYATEFRIITTAPQIGKTNNTGRLCIGNLNISF